MAVLSHPGLGASRDRVEVGVQDQRYLTHYQSLGQDIGLLAVMAFWLCAIMAMMVGFGDSRMWFLGIANLALMGPTVAFLAWDLHVSTKLGRHRTIRFSIDLEGVYDGETRTFLPWSQVTSVKIAIGDSDTTVVVVGWAPDSDVVTFFHNIVGPRSAVESAVQAFAPQVRIDRITVGTMRLLMRDTRHLGVSRRA
jgi:hypothetical protein